MTTKALSKKQEWQMLFIALSACTSSLVFAILTMWVSDLWANAGIMAPIFPIETSVTVATLKAQLASAGFLVLCLLVFEVHLRKISTAKNKLAH